MFDIPPKTLAELKDISLKKNEGATAKEIASRIEEDPDFDERVTKVSPKRFKEIKNAYEKKSLQESKTALNKLLSPGGKVFKDTNDYYLADHYAKKITIEAFEYGSFREPNEKDSWEKANKAYRDLMQYLVGIGSPHADTLSNIRVDKPEETLTLDKFIDSKKEATRETFSSYRQEGYKAYRFNRIFSYIRKKVKTVYENFRKDEARRLKKGEPLLSTIQKINLLTENMNKQTEQRTKAIEGIANTNKEKALYANTLTQKHNLFHKK